MAITLLGFFKWINTFGAVCITTGFALMSTLKVSSGLGAQISFQILVGIGGGILYPGRLVAVQAQQEAGNVAIASAMVSFFASLGEALGVSIASAIFENQWVKEVEKYTAKSLIPAEFVIPGRDAVQTAIALEKFPAVVKGLYRDIMAKTISYVWIATAAVSGLAFVACLASQNLNLQEKATNSNQVLDSYSPDKEETLEPRSSF